MGYDTDEAHIHRDRVGAVEGLDRIGRDEEGLTEAPGPHDAGGDLPFDGTVGQKDIDLRLVRFRDG